ncbi:MAG: hypothetical protein DDT19_00192 [Syntrophomonadaceae bacterium]|nr:hypothetical protein [Bacillota bacterium]
MNNVRRKRLTGTFLLISLLTGIYACQRPSGTFYDIVIFGGGFGGTAAAVSAAKAVPGRSVLLVMPEAAPGGLGSVGGQNFFDIRLWRGELVSGGSFARWYERLGQFYNTETAAELLAAELATHANITVLYRKDLETVRRSQGKIVSLSLREVVLDSDGAIGWGNARKKVRGNVFVDASEEGRLARLAEVELVTGRSDWPKKLLPADEQDGVARQQASTLMFKVQGVATPERPGRFGDLFFVRDLQGSWGAWGGLEVYTSDEVVTVFNRVYGPAGFAIKPFNLAQNGVTSNEWWINILLVFNVDGRANRRDLGTDRFPAHKRPEQIDTDTAYSAAQEFLLNPAFWQALRRFSYTDEKTGQIYGLQEIQPVLDKYGRPVTGESLYLRETVHMPKDGKDEGRFVLTPLECQAAGTRSGDGGDLDNYASRIGLAFYAMDINAYLYSDLLAGENFVWPVTGFLRPDWLASGGEPKNPVYLPYEMLITEAAENLLIPGYATGSASLAWASIRVLPNLTVLGEAAGAAAALSVEKNIPPLRFEEAEITALQDILRKMGAILDKDE